MSSTNLPQVLIVGSGPAGLVAALTLVKNGVSVRIIEKDSEHQISERGAGVMPRTLEIEHFLGVGKEVQSSGLPQPTVHVFDPKDPYRIVKSLVVLEKFEPTPAFPIPAGVMIGQWLHQQILRKHLEALGCQVELSTSLSSFEQLEDAVVARLVKSSNGTQNEELVKISYIIGADGAHSKRTVRKLLGVDFVEHSQERRQERIYLIDLYMEGMNAEGADLYKWGDASKELASLRAGSRPRAFQLLLSGDSVDFGALKTGSVEAVQTELDKLTGRKDLKVTQIISHGEWRPNVRMADRFHDKRAFIVGDAAHVHPPAGGQGLNTSIQDSFNLSWKIALVLNSHAPPTLLDSYEEERTPVIAEMLHITTDLFKKIVEGGDDYRVRVLHAAQATTSERKDIERWVRARKLFQLELNYRWSDIVFDERLGTAKADIDVKGKKDAYGEAGHDIRAGDRAPDAPGLVRHEQNSNADSKDSTRFFDIFSPSAHTLLLFTSSSDISDAAVRSLVTPLQKLSAGLVRAVLVLPSSANDSGIPSASVNLILEDAEGFAYEGYGVDPGLEQPTAVIVRPDGWIGAFARSVEGVEKYLSKIFN